MWWTGQRTADPIADAERASWDNRPVIGNCEKCGCEIHGADVNNTVEADEAFLFDDGCMVCDYCLLDYCRKHYRI